MVFRLAIIGAGPAGCTLARILQTHSTDAEISITIFENEASLNFRSQGGTLDLHETTGLAALEKAKLFDEFLKYARYDGEAFKIMDKNMLAYISMGAGKEGSRSGRPEIDRPQLRQLLFESLREGTVQWNKKLTKIDEDLLMHFADGSTQGGFDLIVGADGAWSKARPLLSSIKPYYSGIAGHSMYIHHAKKTHPDLYELVNRGSAFAWSDGKGLLGQYMSDGSINVSTWSSLPENWQSTYDTHDPETVREKYRKHYADWNPKLSAMIEAFEGEVTPRDLYMLPVGHDWSHRRGVTLIGDAAHLMTPFAGEGVNLAMEDSLKLAEGVLAAVGKSKDVLDANVDAFEKDMFKRATATQQMTVDMMTAMYETPGAPRTCIEKYVVRAVRGTSTSWASWLVTPLVYSWFFAFKLIW